MIITITLNDSDDGTDVLAVHEDLLSGVWADNEIGWHEALRKLAALLRKEGGIATTTSFLPRSS